MLGSFRTPVLPLLLIGALVVCVPIASMPQEAWAHKKVSPKAKQRNAKKSRAGSARKSKSNQSPRLRRNVPRGFVKRTARKPAGDRGVGKRNRRSGKINTKVVFWLAAGAAVLVAGVTLFTQWGNVNPADVTPQDPTQLLQPAEGTGDFDVGSGPGGSKIQLPDEPSPARAGRD